MRPAPFTLPSSLGWRFRELFSGMAELSGPNGDDRHPAAAAMLRNGVEP
jgi:hypothetical protein